MASSRRLQKTYLVENKHEHFGLRVDSKHDHVKSYGKLDAVVCRTNRITIVNNFAVERMDVRQYFLQKEGKELSDLKSCGVKAYESVEYDESNLLHWTVLLVPDKEPYNKGAFKVNIDFPADYPFKPPKITLATKIYHPNIDDKGQVCLPIVDPNNWKPATRTEQVMMALLALIHEPEPDHPLRADLAEEFSKDRKKFNKTAEEFTKKHAEKRPE